NGLVREADERARACDGAARIFKPASARHLARWPVRWTRARWRIRLEGLGCSADSRRTQLVRGAEGPRANEVVMPLASGSGLGPYDILSPLGAGGFGEVYKARDTRLDRTVAIKILPSTDPELKARFEREAKAIAALTHPHICTLYDVGHQDGTDYLVTRQKYLEARRACNKTAET